MIRAKRFSTSTGHVNNASPDIIYTATDVYAQVHACTVINMGGANTTVALWLVPASASATGANRVLSAKTLVPNESYRVTEIIGQWLNPGDTIQCQAGAATSISIMCGGIEATF